MPKMCFYPREKKTPTKTTPQLKGWESKLLKKQTTQPKPYELTAPPDANWNASRKNHLILNDLEKQQDKEKEERKNAQLVKELLWKQRNDEEHEKEEEKKLQMTGPM